MSLDLTKFVPELREKIYSYCSTSDLINVACCNKEYYEAVIYLLWAVVKTRWKFLEKKSMVKKRTKHLKFTTTLYISECGSFPSRKKEDCRAANYKYIIKHCDPQRFSSLQLDGYIVSNGLELASATLSGIRELSLSNIFHADWEYLCRFEQLRKISLQNSNILDGSLKEVYKLSNLRELIVVQCLELTKVSLHHIGNAAKLKKLTFSYDWSLISTYDYIHSFTNLNNLVELSLEFTGINDNYFANATRNLKNLNALNVSWCRHLTDTGLMYICRLVSLKKLNISRCTKVTNRGLFHLSALRLLNSLDISGCTDITDVGLPYLNSVLKLTKVNISFCTNITYDGILKLRGSHPCPLFVNS